MAWFCASRDLSKSQIALILFLQLVLNKITSLWGIFLFWFPPANSHSDSAEVPSSCSVLVDQEAHCLAGTQGSLEEAWKVLQESLGKALVAVEGLVHLGIQAVEVVGILAVHRVEA
jgi:hypothetical protein